MKLFVGHDPTVDIAGHEGEGVDLLLTIHDDDTHEFAVRPGEGRRDLRWGPPSLLVAEPDVYRPHHIADHRKMTAREAFAAITAAITKVLP